MALSKRVKRIMQRLLNPLRPSVKLVTANMSIDVSRNVYDEFLTIDSWLLLLLHARSAPDCFRCCALSEREAYADPAAVQSKVALLHACQFARFDGDMQPIARFRGGVAERVGLSVAVPAAHALLLAHHRGPARRAAHGGWGCDVMRSGLLNLNLDVVSEHQLIGRLLKVRALYASRSFQCCRAGRSSASRASCCASPSHSVS